MQNSTDAEILNALAADGECIRRVPLALQTERMARVALQQTPRAYYYFSNALRADPQLARLAVQGDFENYCMAPKIMQSDPEMLLFALLRNPKFAQSVNDEQLLQRTLELATSRLRELAACRTAFAACALHSGPANRLRAHGIHFLRQFNARIIGYAGIEDLLRRHYQVYVNPPVGV